jgi:glycosyltransferase involved in cell wall biosynthesis
MKFSVVIPALNESKHIASAIKALNKQTLKRSDFEIIVIDSQSTDDTVEVARNLGADKVLSEKMFGPNSARQRGVDLSQGEIVAFLDADCLPSSDWLARIQKNLSQPGVAAVSGPYDYGFTGLAKIIDQFQLLFLPHMGSLLHILFRRKAGVLIGGNFAAYRSGIDTIGGLPPLKFFGDDAAIAMLLSRHVGKVVFDPDLKVKSSPRRFEKEGMLKLQIIYSFSYFKAYFSKDYI